jgi:hypothetical protein
MKKFILYVLFFFGCFLLSDLLLVYVTKKSFDEQVFELPVNKQILILGDSHLECALNDSIVDNAVNLCHSGEAYIYTYTKMKLFLVANPHIRTVWLSFNFRSLSKEAEEWLYNDEGVLNIDRYVCFFEREEESFFSKDIRYYLSIMRLPYIYRGLTINNMLVITRTYNNLRWGGYLRLVQHNSQSKEIKLPDGVENYRSYIQYKYLNKIVEYCCNNNINLILINSPMRNRLQLDTNSYYDYINDNYGNVKLWDYADFSLPDSCYADVEHLNYKGAEIFSKYIYYLNLPSSFFTCLACQSVI